MSTLLTESNSKCRFHAPATLWKSMNSSFAFLGLCTSYPLKFNTTSTSTYIGRFLNILNMLPRLLRSHCISYPPIRELPLIGSQLLCWKLRLYIYPLISGTLLLLRLPHRVLMELNYGTLTEEYISWSLATEFFEIIFLIW